jgi:hypothetical protein
MILKFPDLATLQLALTSSAVPPAVSQTPAVASFDGEQVWVQTNATLGRATQNELKKMGVQVCRSAGGGPTMDVSSWVELLPLRAEPDVLAGLEQTPVLVDVPDGEQMARLAGEMLRLGNDRQGFRWLEDTPNGAGRALLRVVGPPYYSLLRALDRRERPEAPVAYVERAPGVWVEAGFDHPLAERVKPPAGRLLLLRPPRQWTLLADAPFRDVYEVLQFQVPDGTTSWQEGQLHNRLQVRLSLRPGGSPDNPELWVLGGDAVEELNRFVQNSDDQMLSRLAFAVGGQGDRKTIVVRVRQSRQPPPQLVLQAVGYRAHLKLPNLFLPAGMGLHPPLRRDKVRELFAEDLDRVTWLAPGPEGTFTAQSLAEDAFRPLTDWVDYVLDQDREALEAWVQAARFGFEDFVCNEDGTPKPRKSEPAERPRPTRKGHGRGSAEKDDGAAASFQSKGPPPQAQAAAELDPFADEKPAPPSELEKELHTLEQKFLELEGPLDMPERRALWPRMARCHAGTNRPEDAGLCWLHGVWGEPAVPAGCALHWFAAEAAAALRGGEGGKRPRSWLARLSGANPPRPDLAGDDLDRLLKDKEPPTADLRALTAYLAWAAGQPRPPAALMDRLPQLHGYLEAHERMLPVRGMWLAWVHLAQLSGGDALALARARDRLLERLFHNGMRPEQDLPSFLRFAGQPTAQRFRAVRDWMLSLADLVQRWVHKNADPAQKAPTDAYSDFLFAFAVARLGESDAARRLLARGEQALAGKDDAHSLLLEAFRYRVTQALDGRPHAGPLPQALLDSLNEMHGRKDPGLRPYVVDRLRQHSRVLEPDQRLEAYSRQLARTSPLDKQLAELTDLGDRKELAARFAKLLRALPGGHDDHDSRTKVLLAALNAAPRVGEDFGCAMVGHALSAFDAMPESAEAESLRQRVQLLEKALFVAAHFDRAEHIHPLVVRFQRLLQANRRPEAVEKMEEVAAQCFRGLRKLGMRDEIDRLLTQMADLILEGRDPSSVGPEALPALLRVAAEWYFFGRDSQAETILQVARSVLQHGDLLKKDYGFREQTRLACAYARTVGQAPVAVAQKRLEEIFTAVPGIRDTFTTGSHYSLAQLSLVEAVVLAVVSDDFTLGTQARRWLDEDEFLVRRRVHADVKALRGGG